MLVYIFTFLLPPFFYGILLSVIHFTPEKRRAGIWLNFIPILLIPATWYVLIEIPYHRYNDIGRNLVQLITWPFFVSGTVVFIFFLMRLIFQIARDKSSIKEQHRFYLKAVGAIVLPVLCFLFINSKGSWGDPARFIGDFSGPFYFMAAIINGFLLIRPEPENLRSRLASFLCKSVLFAFVFYFFLVLLPYTPLSLIAILMFGFGFLMFTPTIVMILSTKSLIEDFRFLSRSIKPVYVALLFAMGFLTIPVYTWSSFLHQKNNLANVLEYVYEPDYLARLAIPN